VPASIPLALSRPATSEREADLPPRGEAVVIPASKDVARPRFGLDDLPSAGAHYAARSEPVDAARVRGGDLVIGYATEPHEERSRDRYRVGTVVIKWDLPDLRTHIEIKFFDESLTWEGPANAALPVCRRS